MSHDSAFVVRSLPYSRGGNALDREDREITKICRRNDDHLVGDRGNFIVSSEHKKLITPSTQKGKVLIASAQEVIASSEGLKLASKQVQAAARKRVRDSILDTPIDKHVTIQMRVFKDDGSSKIRWLPSLKGTPLREVKNEEKIHMEQNIKAMYSGNRRQLTLAQQLKLFLIRRLRYLIGLVHSDILLVVLRWSPGTRLLELI